MVFDIKENSLLNINELYEKMTNRKDYFRKWGYVLTNVVNE